MLFLSPLFTCCWLHFSLSYFRYYAAAWFSFFHAYHADAYCCFASMISLLFAPLIAAVAIDIRFSLRFRCCRHTPLPPWPRHWCLRCQVAAADFAVIITLIAIRHYCFISFSLLLHCFSPLIYFALLFIFADYFHYIIFSILILLPLITPFSFSSPCFRFHLFLFRHYCFRHYAFAIVERHACCRCRRRHFFIADADAAAIITPCWCYMLRFITCHMLLHALMLFATFLIIIDIGFHAAIIMPSLSPLFSFTPLSLCCLFFTLLAIFFWCYVSPLLCFFFFRRHTAMSFRFSLLLPLFRRLHAFIISLRMSPFIITITLRRFRLLSFRHCRFRRFRYYADAFRYFAAAITPFRWYSYFAAAFAAIIDILIIFIRHFSYYAWCCLPLLLIRLFYAIFMPCCVAVIIAYLPAMRAAIELLPLPPCHADAITLLATYIALCWSSLLLACWYAITPLSRHSYAAFAYFLSMLFSAAFAAALRFSPHITSLFRLFRTIRWYWCWCFFLFFIAVSPPAIIFRRYFLLRYDAFDFFFAALCWLIVMLFRSLSFRFFAFATLMLISWRLFFAISSSAVTCLSLPLLSFSFLSLPLLIHPLIALLYYCHFLSSPLLLLLRRSYIRHYYFRRHFAIDIFAAYHATLFRRSSWYFATLFIFAMLTPCCHWFSPPAIIAVTLISWYFADADAFSMLSPLFSRLRYWYVSPLSLRLRRFDSCCRYYADKTPLFSLFFAADMPLLFSSSLRHIFRLLRFAKHCYHAHQMYTHEHTNAMPLLLMPFFMPFALMPRRFMPHWYAAVSPYHWYAIFAILRHDSATLAASHWYAAPRRRYFDCFRHWCFRLFAIFAFRHYTEFATCRDMLLCCWY